MVFSLLIGASLAAGIAALVLTLRGFVGALRSPLPVSDESWCIWAVLIAVVVLCAGWVIRPSRRMTAGSFWGAAIILALTSFFAYPLLRSGVSNINESGAAMPDYIGRLITAWVCFAIAVLANIAGRACGRASLPAPESRGSSSSSEANDDADQDIAMSDDLARLLSRLPFPRESRREETAEGAGWRRMNEYALRLGLGVVGAATATALAVTAPTVISKRIDPFTRITTSALSSHDGYPTVEEMATAAGREQSTAAAPLWEVPFGFGEADVDQILAGVRGAAVITSRGVYGLDSSTGEVTWSFAAADLEGSSDKNVIGLLRGVDVYAGESAFTSPNGAWLAYAFDVTPEDSAGGISPLEDLTRIVVLNTDTGRIALDTQVAGSAPTVQLTDSTAVINRRVYDISSGRELSPLDDEKTVIPGPGGHSAVLTRDKYQNLETSSSVITEPLSDRYFRETGSEQWRYDGQYDSITARVVDGQVINVGGWVVNDDYAKAIQNIDTGRTVSLNNKGESSSWRIVGIEASAQAVSTWSVQDYVDGDAGSYGHPLELNVFDTRTGKVTAIDPAGTYRTVFGDGRAPGVSYSGAVDTALFSARVDDGLHAGIYDDLVVEQNDAARQHDAVAGRSGSRPEPPWVSISLPQFSSEGNPVALCPGGVIVSIESTAVDKAITARKAPR
jgi:membrane protein